MITSTRPAPLEDLSLGSYRTRANFSRSVSWGAIFAGFVAALALQVLFMLLGAGLGFALYTPLTDANPVADLGKGAVVIQGISAVFSLWFGGWIAGRLTPLGARRAGWLHGFVVWCAATVAGVLVVTGGAGWMLGDLSKLVGGGLSAAGKPAAALAGASGSAARDAIAQTKDTLSSFTEESVGSLPAGSQGANSIRAKREVGLAVARLFSSGQEPKAQENRAALVKTLVDATGRSETEADRLVTDWTTSYNHLKQDLAAAKDQADARARQLADDAADRLAVFSLCAFVAFVIGAIAAGSGGSHGAMCANKRDEIEIASLSTL